MAEYPPTRTLLSPRGKPSRGAAPRASAALGRAVHITLKAEVEDRLEEMAAAAKAASDEAILSKLLGDSEVPDDVLGFHAQQAVGKLLKAVPPSPLDERWSSPRIALSRYAVVAARRWACAYRVSGATSAWLGQTIVPASASARSWRK